MQQVRERIVVGRLAHRHGPPVRAAVDVGPGPGGEHRLSPPSECVAHLDAGTLAVHVGERAGVAIAQPALVVVVHRECPARPQERPHVLHRLLREQVVLQPQHALPRKQRQRIRQREHDQVVLAVRVLRKRAAVVDVDADAPARIRVVRVVLAPEPLDLRVDLDGVDVLRALRERDRDVVPVAGSHDELVVRGAADVAVGKEVEGLDPMQRAHRIRGLVRDVVRGDRQRPVRGHAAHGRMSLHVLGGDLVIRRPVVVGVGRLDRQQRDDRHERQRPPTPTEEREQQHARDRSPGDRRQPQERQQ